MPCEQAHTDHSNFTIVAPRSWYSRLGPAKTRSASRTSRPRCSKVRSRLAGSKLITGQKALDEGNQWHGSAAGNPMTAVWNPAPALHLELGIAAGEVLHSVAVLCVSCLLRAGQGLGLMLGSQKGRQEAGGFSGSALGCGKAPGGSGGVAVVVEIEMAHRSAGKAFERVDGAGGQGT